MHHPVQTPVEIFDDPLYFDQAVIAKSRGYDRDGDEESIMSLAVLVI